jgi:thiosulfate dehydrogenase (quinone) large subunit
MVISPEKKHRRMLVAILRVAVGWVFLWAFLDKLFGLGFSTCAAKEGTQYLCEKAWLQGGSPTAGFLLNATSEPFASIFQAMQGPLVDWLFMIGLLGIGAALIIGFPMKLAAYSGSVLLVLMFLAAPPKNNPLLDDHIIYAIVLILLAWIRAGHYYGLGQWWENHKLVARHPWMD